LPIISVRSSGRFRGRFLDARVDVIVSVKDEEAALVGGLGGIGDALGAVIMDDATRRLDEVASREQHGLGASDLDFAEGRVGIAGALGLP